MYINKPSKTIALFIILFRFWSTALLEPLVRVSLCSSVQRKESLMRETFSLLHDTKRLWTPT
jgi:hypothetical protein